ncbi:MAG: hypothetical protein O7C75_09090, partial [Verrucomicrobia bacterium]|nr:hypothetical protein [Verrucomicrobiota bacterium]
MKVLRYWIISISLASLLGGCSQNALEDRDTQVLIAVGPSNHPPGSHEVAAGARLIEHCLENMENVPGVQADVVYDWSEVPQALDAYATVVFIGDNFPGERLPNSETAMEQLIAMMARGCGIVCVHYGVGLLDEDVERGGDHPLLHWMGGYFASRCEHHRSTAKIYEAATIEAADPEHPVSRGWDILTLNDEPYSNIYFGPNNNQLLPGAFAMATSMLPPENPKQEI